MLYSLNLENCKNLQSVSQLPKIGLISFRNCISLERINFNFGMQNHHGVLLTRGCRKLTEIEGLGKLEATGDMDADRAKFMGYSGLYGFDGSKGMYLWEYGLYSVLLRGNHIANWFTEVTSSGFQQYIVPLNPNCVIRAFNVGCMFKCESRPLYSITLGTIRVKNVSCNWNFLYGPVKFVAHWMGSEVSCELTWLSHWRVDEHRELRPGDQLEVSFSFSSRGYPLTCGIKILYEEVEEDKAEDVDRDNAMQTCSSSSSSREGMNTDDVIGHEDEERRENTKNDSAVVVDWYKDTFRAPDLCQYRDKWNNPRRFKMCKIFP